MKEKLGTTKIGRNKPIHVKKYFLYISRILDLPLFRMIKMILRRREKLKTLRILK